MIRTSFIAFALASLAGCALFETPPSPPPAEAAGDPAPPPTPAFIAPISEEALMIKKKILVLPLIDHTERIDDTLVKAAMKQIGIALGTMPDILTLSPADLGEDGLGSELGTYNLSKVFSIARREGIAGVLMGSIDSIDQTDQSGANDVGLFHTQQFNTQVKVRLDLYDVISQKQMYSKSVTGEVTEERAQIFDGAASETEERDRARQAVSKALTKLLAGLPALTGRIAWSGRIAKIDLHRYYITGGRATGLLPGQLLRVYVDGEPIYDPETGKLLGIAPGRLKGLLKIVENFGPDASIAIVHSGAGFHEQDRVEPFIPPQN